MVHFKVKIPLMSDREGLISIKLAEQSDGSLHYFLTSVDHPDYPVKKDTIRVEIFKALRVQQKGSDLLVEVV